MKKFKRALKCTVMLALAVCMLFCMSAPAYADLADVQADASGVLQMNFTIKDDFGKEWKVPSGSCFLINEDTVVTCYHVVDPSMAYYLYMYFYQQSDFQGSISGLSGSEAVEKIASRVTYSVTVSRDITVNASYVNGSAEMDFAILKLSQPLRNRTPLALRSSADVKSAETVYALGFPSNSDTKAISTYTTDDVTFSSGVVSKTQAVYSLLGNGTYIQTSCKISGGNSGGPMVDADGNVIGISSNGQQSYEYYTNDEGEVVFATSTEDYFFCVAIDQVIDLCDTLGIPYTLTNTKSEPAPEPVPETPAEQPAPEPVPETPAEQPALNTEMLEKYIVEASALQEKGYTAESYSAMRDALNAAVSARSAQTQAEVDSAANQLNTAILKLEKASNNTTLYIIIGAIAAAVILVVAILLAALNSKKKNAAAARRTPAYAAAPAAPAPGSTGAFTAPPTAPARPVTPPTGVPASDPGATTILQGKVEATTILANGGTITRVKNGDKLDIRVQEILVGRDGNVCNFWISGNTNIGRKHAKFLVRNGTTYVVDCQSTNGTFVNGVKLQPNVETALKDGDKITLADEDFRFTK